MSRSAVAAVLQRLDQIAGWLGEGKSPRHTAALATLRFGLSRTAANRYVASAVTQLVHDAAQEPLESKRARMIAVCHAMIRRALERKRSFARNGKVVTYDSPDLSAANQAGALLMKLELGI